MFHSLESFMPFDKHFSFQYRKRIKPKSTRFRNKETLSDQTFPGKTGRLIPKVKLNDPNAAMLEERFANYEPGSATKRFVYF